MGYCWTRKILLELEATKGMIRTNTIYLKKLMDKKMNAGEEEQGMIEAFDLPLSSKASVQAAERLLQTKNNENAW